MPSVYAGSALIAVPRVSACRRVVAPARALSCSSWKKRSRLLVPGAGRVGRLNCLNMETRDATDHAAHPQRYVSQNDRERDRKSVV